MRRPLTGMSARGKEARRVGLRGLMERSKYGAGGVME